MNWDFLIALTRAPKVFSAAVACGAALAVAWSLRLFGLPSIDATGLTFAAVGTTALAYFLLSVSVHAWQHWRTQVRIAPFSKLTEAQRDFLKQIHSSGDREFTVPHNRTSQNWLVQLRERGYIAISWVGSEGVRYHVTTAAWAEMDKGFGPNRS